MPATPTDIAAGTREAVIATAFNSAIAARYPAARDAGASPSPGFFDSIVDAQTVVNQRAALIGTERRRFVVGVDEPVWPDVAAGLLQVRLVDGEQGANLAALVARIEVDLETESTALEVFG